MAVLPFVNTMPLKLRPSGLGSGIDKDRPDYLVLTGEWEVGRIYKTRGGPDSLRWFWSLTVNGPMTRSDRVAILEEAKSQFQTSGTLGRRGRTWRRSSGSEPTTAVNSCRVPARQPLSMAHYAPLRRGAFLWCRNIRSAPGVMASRLDEIVIGAAVLCVVALALLLTVKIEPR